MIPDKVVQGFIKTLLPGIKVIKHTQPGKAPALPYVAWSEISNPANGREQIEYKTISGNYTEDINLNKTETIQVDCYSATAAQKKNNKITSKSAYELAEEMVIRLNSTNSMIYQSQNNIGVMGWEDISPLTAFLGDVNELRSTIEIRLNNNLNYQDQAYSAGDIDVNLTLEDI